MGAWRRLRGSLLNMICGKIKKVVTGKPLIQQPRKGKKSIWWSETEATKHLSEALEVNLKNKVLKLPLIQQSLIRILIINTRIQDF